MFNKRIFNHQSTRITTDYFSGRNLLTGLTWACIFWVDFIFCGKNTFTFFEIFY